MTINDLIDKLEYIRDSHEDGGDFKIVGALQQTYPMRGSLLNICTDSTEKEVYLAMSDNLGYGVPNCVWDDEEVWDDDGEEY